MSIKSALEDVERFHRAANIPNLVGKARFTKRKMRKRILNEEIRELKKAIRERDMVAAADGYADIMFVTLGSALMQVGKGRFTRAWAEVCRTNMAKCIDGKVVMREDGKVLKPKGWTPPNIAAIIASDEPDITSVASMEDEMNFAVDAMRATIAEMKGALDEGVDKDVMKSTLDGVATALDEMRRGVMELL